MTRLDNLKNHLRDIERELEALKIFRFTPQMKRFQRQIEGEKSFIKSELNKLKQSEIDSKRLLEEKRNIANKNRSSKNKRTWNYVKSIQTNYFPDKSAKEIRSSLKKHRQGLETDIPDVAWRNPSP